MVYPPTIEDETVVQDTDIEQSILNEIFQIEQVRKNQGILNQTSEKINDQSFGEIVSLRDFEEEEENVHDSEFENNDLAELPDHSEYEEIIDWDDPPDSENLTDGEKKFYDGTQDLDINES